MRSALNAPVDKYGCERLACQECTPQNFRFQTLVALMLSSQTKDEVTASAFKILQQKLGECFGAAEMVQIAVEEIDDCIRSVGFHRRKSLYLHQTSTILMRDYMADIPRTFDELVKLPGVGPKMVISLLGKFML